MMIYLDNAATTMPSSCAIEAFNKARTKFFNPSSIYLDAIAVSKEINAVRMQILSEVGLTTSHNVLFTSGATEADNMAILQAKKFRGKKVLVSLGEHSAIFNSAKNLEGTIFDTINLKNDGTVDEENLKSKLQEGDVCLVAIMQVNNETGATNEINKLCKIVKDFSKDILFVCDAVQGFKKIPYKFSRDVDFISISSHKIGGFKGTGALIYNQKLNLKPLIYGGGQEFNLRSGTENVGGILAFGAAISQNFDFKQMQDLNNFARKELSEKIKNVHFNANGSPYILSISIAGVKSEVVVRMMDERGFCLSSGSACNSKKADNRVLSAMGLSKAQVEGTIRASFSHSTTKDEIKLFAENLAQVVEELKK